MWTAMKKSKVCGGKNQSFQVKNSARLFGRHGLFWGGIVGHGLFFIYAMAPQLPRLTAQQLEDLEAL